MHQTEHTIAWSAGEAPRPGPGEAFRPGGPARGAGQPRRRASGEGSRRVGRGDRWSRRGRSKRRGRGGGDIVLVVLPWDGHAELLAELAPALVGKIVVDCVNPLGFDKQGAYALPVQERSATQQAAALLPASRVVGAFHNVSAVLLGDPEVDSVDTDVLVLADDRAATDAVQALADVIPGMRGIYAGRLRNAHQVEALTANLISINRRYNAHAGVRVTDVVGG